MAHGSSLVARSFAGRARWCAGGACVAATLLLLASWRKQPGAAPFAPARALPLAGSASAPGAPAVREPAARLERAPLAVPLARATVAAAVPTLSGVVSDATGGTIEGALLSLPGAPGASALSDRLGQFQLAAPAGSVLLAVQADGYSSTTLALQAPAAHVRIALEPAAQLRGRVIARESGAALGGVNVTLAPVDGIAPARTLASSADGSFHFQSLAAGQYEILALSEQRRAPPQPLRLELGETRSDLVLSAEAAASLHGKVMLRGQACAAGEVELSGPVSETQQLADAGQVRFVGLLPGSYRVRIDCDAALASREEQLSIGAQHVTRDWELEAGLQLHGRVEDPAGAPVSAAQVHVMALAAQAGCRARTCTTDDAGRFACSGLCAGSHQTRVYRGSLLASEDREVALPQPPETELVLVTQGTATIEVALTQQATACADCETAEEVALGALQVLDERGAPATGTRHGRTQTFTDLPLGEYAIQLGAFTSGGDRARVRLEQPGQHVRVQLERPSLSSIRGRVLDTRGEPVPDARVSGSGATGATALSDASGEFELPGLLPGRYALIAEDTVGRAQLAGVEAGAAGLALRIVPAASLAGLVLDSTGRRVSHFHVAVQRVDEGSLFFVTGHDGVWSAARLEPGSYLLQLDSEHGSADERVELRAGEERGLRTQLLHEASAPGTRWAALPPAHAPPDAASTAPPMASATPRD